MSLDKELFTRTFTAGTYEFKSSFGLDAISILNGGEDGDPDIQVIGTKKVGTWDSEAINIAAGKFATLSDGLGWADFNLIVPATGTAIVFAK